MLFFPEIRRMKHPRCFPKFAWCSPTASAWCAVATRPLRYISQNHVCEFCFFFKLQPANIVLRSVPQRPSSSRTPPGRSWHRRAWGSSEGASFFVFPVQKIPILSNSHFRGKMPVFYFGPDSHLFEIPFVREGTVLCRDPSPNRCSCVRPSGVRVTLRSISNDI